MTIPDDVAEDLGIARDSFSTILEWLPPLHPELKIWEMSHLDGSLECIRIVNERTGEVWSKLNFDTRKIPADLGAMYQEILDQGAVLEQVVKPAIIAAIPGAEFTGAVMMEKPDGTLMQFDLDGANNAVNGRPFIRPNVKFKLNAQKEIIVDVSKLDPEYAILVSAALDGNVNIAASTSLVG